MRGWETPSSGGTETGQHKRKRKRSRSRGNCCVNRPPLRIVPLLYFSTYKRMENDTFIILERCITGTRKKMICDNQSMCFQGRKSWRLCKRGYAQLTSDGGTRPQTQSYDDPSPSTFFARPEPLCRVTCEYHASSNLPTTIYLSTPLSKHPPHRIVPPRRFSPLLRTYFF